MIREPLLLETLVSRRMTRQGEIFMWRRPQGPPPGDDQIDRWLHQATQSFDFAPLFNGDQQQARIVAQRYIEHLKKTASQDGIDWRSVKERLKQVSPHLRRGLRTFFAFYDAAIRAHG